MFPRVRSEPTRGINFYTGIDKTKLISNQKGQNDMLIKIERSHLPFQNDVLYKIGNIICIWYYKADLIKYITIFVNVIQWQFVRVRVWWRYDCNLFLCKNGILNVASPNPKDNNLNKLYSTLPEYASSQVLFYSGKLFFGRLF